jgi:hypothetical protein
MYTPPKLWVMEEVNEGTAAQYNDGMTFVHGVVEVAKPQRAVAPNPLNDPQENRLAAAVHGSCDAAPPKAKYHGILHHGSLLALQVPTLPYRLEYCTE